LHDLGFLVWRRGMATLPHHLVRACQAAVLLQPLQLFTHFDLSVPGVLIKIVPLAGKNPRVAWNVQLVQRAVEQVVL